MLPPLVRSNQIKRSEGADEMGIYQLCDADVEAVVNLLKKGKSMQEVAADLQISVEMVVCATRKWPAIRRKQGIYAVL